MRAADATDTHMTMIRNVIAWMEYVGLITVQDDTVTATGEGQGAVTVVQADAPHPGGGEAPADTGDTGTKSTGPDEGPAPVVMFEVAVRLTVDDLAVLTPEQIKAFFEAVGTLAALRRAE